MELTVQREDIEKYLGENDYLTLKQTLAGHPSVVIKMLRKRMTPEEWHATSVLLGMRL